MPNYEVNGDLIVRNKKTGNILKPYIIKGRRTPIVFLAKRQRSPRLCYQRTLDAITNDEWLPVPSLDGKYELNPVGELRNARTKSQIKLNKHQYYAVRCGSKTKLVSKNALLYEVYKKESLIPPAIKSTKKREPHSTRSIGVSISKGNEHYTFRSIQECCRFLEKRERHAKSHLAVLMTIRPPVLYGWSLTYDDIEWRRRNEQINIHHNTRRAGL